MSYSEPKLTFWDVALTFTLTIVKWVIRAFILMFVCNLAGIECAFLPALILVAVLS